MSEEPKVEKIFVDISNGRTIEQSRIKEYCENHYKQKVVECIFGDITFVTLENGQMVTFFELQDYVDTTERLNEIEKKLGV